MPARLNRVRAGLVAALAVTAAATVGVAPASAQTPPQPPCTPSGPVVAAVDCAFDTVLWADDQAEAARDAAPGLVFDTARAAFDQVVTETTNALRFVTETQDFVEWVLVNETCHQLEMPEGECAPDR